MTEIKLTRIDNGYLVENHALTAAALGCARIFAPTLDGALAEIRRAMGGGRISGGIEKAPPSD